MACASTLRRPLLTIPVVVLAAGLLGSGMSSAQASSSELPSPRVLSGGNHWAENADIAIRADGSSIAAWEESGTADSPTAIKVAAQDKFGRWGEARTLSTGTTSARLPKIVTNGSEVSVAWQQGTTGSERIMLAEFEGKWKSPRALSPKHCADVELAMDPAGITSLSWIRHGVARASAVEFAQEKPAGAFHTQTLTNGSESAKSQSMTLSESGKPTVVWYSMDGNYKVRAASPGAGSKPRVTTLSANDLSTQAVEPDVSTRAGRTTAVWQETTGDGSQHISYATRDGRGEWSAAAPLPEADGGAANPQVGVDGSGLATVLWIKSGMCDQGMVSEQRADGTWKQAERITEEDRDNDGLRLDVAADGRAVAAWPGIDPADYPYRPPAQINVRGADGNWTGVKSLSAAGNKCFDPIAKINDSGDIAAIWSLGNGESTSRVEAVTSLTPR